MHDARNITKGDASYANVRKISTGTLAVLALVAARNFHLSGMKL